jgi:hypothetical protein
VEVQVEQKGEIKMMWKRHQFSTFLTVTEDGRDPSALLTSFTLIKSVSNPLTTAGIQNREVAPAFGDTLCQLG